jgi:uncharacterized NAD(P)/FAD-binding protein YdhS
VGKQIPTVVIIGGGASGSLTAIHLLSRPSTESIRLVLVERDSVIGGGVAFSTESDRHLLNVAACGMSAFEGEPLHFVRWLTENFRGYDHASYAPRLLYGRYLAETLCQHAGLRGRRDEFETIRDEVVDLDAWPRPCVTLAGGRRIHPDAVVLASGLVAPKVPVFAKGIEGSSRFISDPWANRALGEIERDAKVTLVGSGLTAIDVVLSLEQAGHRGVVEAVSRHGLLPRAHRPMLPRDEALMSQCAELRSMGTRELLRSIRTLVDQTESRGGDWRQVIDALRCKTAALWKELPEVERSRFRRHLERYWSVHRHRMAPQVAETVDRLTSCGRLQVRAGHIDTIRESSNSQDLEVVLRRGSRGATETLRSAWVINCSGPDPHVFSEPESLLARLRTRHLANPGPLGVGVATDQEGRLLDDTGLPVAWLWTLGSLRQGQLLESTAVPEIRRQASDIAVQVRKFLSERSAARDAKDGTTRLVGQNAQELERSYV